MREVLETPEDERRAACGCLMEEITEILASHPDSFFLREIVRKKHA